MGAERVVQRTRGHGTGQPFMRPRESVGIRIHQGYDLKLWSSHERRQVVALEHAAAADNRQAKPIVGGSHRVHNCFPFP